MFRKRSSGELPTHAYGGRPARTSFQKPKLPTCATGGSWLWLVVSVSVILWGIAFLKTPTDLRHLKCPVDREDLCEIVVLTEDEDRIVHTFPGKDLINVEAIRVRRGRAINSKNMRRKQVRKLGYSFQLVVKLDEDGREARHVMSYGSVGRSDARQRVSEVQEYVTRGEEGPLDVYESSGVSAVGILLVIYGAFSLIFCLILGQFAEPPPPRKRR
jgi:hypothetical protein